VKYLTFTKTTRMERRDYLLTQIQQLARVIRLLIERLQGKNSLFNLEEELDQQQEKFREQNGFDIHLLAAPDVEELKDALAANRGYNAENIELLADYMVLLASKSENSAFTLIWRMKQNAIHLYEMVEHSEKTYSLERQQKIAALRQNEK
jgi:hypothetical protein